MMKEKRQPGNFLVFLLLLAAGVCVLLALPDKSARSKSDFSSTNPKALPSAYSPEVEDLVNKHLYMTSQKEDWAEKKMKAENTFMAPEVGHAILPSGKKSASLDHSADSYEGNAFNDLNRYPKELNYASPDEVIQGSLQDQQRQKTYDQIYRKEFARQFIENARQHGYNVKLNDDMVVISVTPIVNPTFSVPALPDSRRPSSQQER
jgi:hypothetical protein